ncbi:MAG: SET domain-containing protein-lysine N-methyltransferase [Nitrospirae bacterium]|nr:SET domain-containing protein-lysine N-methyltransferase [Nitrospirota bacterium]MDA1303127.1 SET domain-containing protein-lysine N-methyltransferase [Nitrospirota bacterium]
MLLVRTVIFPSPIHGIGLFAEEFIPAHTVIWQFDPKFDVAYTKQEFNTLSPAAQLHIRKYSYFSAEMNLWILCGDDARFMNHADAPNTFEEPGIRTIALYDIDPGQELLCDYQQFDVRSFDENDFTPEKKLAAS